MISALLVTTWLDAAWMQTGLLPGSKFGVIAGVIPGGVALDLGLPTRLIADPFQARALVEVNAEQAGIGASIGPSGWFVAAGGDLAWGSAKPGIWIGIGAPL